MWCVSSLCPQLVFDCHPGDVYACVADIGWITGHSYVVYDPLCNGVTSVLFESTPLYPDAGERGGEGARGRKGRDGMLEEGGEGWDGMLGEGGEGWNVRGGRGRMGC